MTPKEIAHDIIEQENVYLAQAYQLAQAYIQMESRMQKLEKVVDAARGIIHREVIGGYGYEGYPELNSALHDLAELDKE